MPENSFLWYKNLNLPNVAVKIKFKGLSIQVPHLKVQLLSFKKDGGSQKLVHSQLRGKTVLPFQNDEAEFKQVKFSETSYKNGKCRFYLAVLILDALDEEKPI
eukprot:TRINITY_DN66108_c0_g1_i1.p1 TRINITY_DN66108_c0_g1~~TRINITY_DN66108_c0_g1_i1.p1  ORF type:complete len:103 (+),score=8.84 TRINITY_DN66108_c0_g1_i1:223-531(+)